MDTGKLVVEKKNIPAGATDTQSAPTVKLVEMGAVSVETKGFFRGLEIGYTPRS